MPDLEDLSQTFADASGTPQTEFKYGWCYTDWKDGKQIMDEHRVNDFLHDEPYASEVKKALEKLGLPLPDDQEIYRGTHHDLLFLNSHGVVVRVGPLEPDDLINPSFLQPLGWVNTDLKVTNKIPDRFQAYAYQQETTLAVTIYPGIEQYESWKRDRQSPPKATSLRDFLVDIGQGIFDLSESNKGIIRIVDDGGREFAVELLADVENEWNPAPQSLSRRRLETLHRMEQIFDNKADAMARTMAEVFRKIPNAEVFMRAFEAHQPLRRLYWDAFSKAKGSDDKPDPAKMAAFWEACAKATRHPHTALLPVWHKTTGADATVAYKRDEVIVPQVALYRQWTKQPEDQIIPPIPQDVKDAVARTHADLVTRDRPAAAAIGRPATAM